MFKEARKTKPQDELPSLRAGLKIQDALQGIRNTNSRKEKEQYLRAISKTAQRDEFFEGCKLAYQYDVTFGVADIPLHTDEGNTNLSWQEFNSLAQSLLKRELTGNAAKAAIQAAMNKSNEDQWNGWYRCILIRDLKAGVSETTINKILAQEGLHHLMIETYSPALAEHVKRLWSSPVSSDGSGLDLIPEIPYKEMTAEIKLNGVRLNLFLDPTNKDMPVKSLSRDGLEMPNWQSIELTALKILNKIKTPIVLDGEIMTKNFSGVMKQIHRKDGVQTDDFVFHVFDVIPISEFKLGESKQPYRQRILDRRAVQEILDEQGLKNIRALTSHWFDLRTEEGRQKLEEFRVKALDAGYEGLVIKDPDATYKTKRTKDWLAYKPQMTIDLEVTGFESGDKDSKNANSLGALVCEGVYEGKQIKVNVGSGLKQDQRDVIWNDKGAYLGLVVEIECDEVTKAENSATYSLRFPRLKKFRGSKPGKKEN